MPDTYSIMSFNNAHENDLLVRNSPVAKKPKVKNKSNLKSKYERKLCDVA